MNKDAKIGIVGTAFICLISLLAWSYRQKVDENEIAFVKHKKEVYQFPVGTPVESIRKWSKQRDFDFRITTRKDPHFEKTNIVLLSGVPLKNINTYGTAFSKKDFFHGYQFLFNRKRTLIKAWAEDYSPGVKSNYSP